MAVGYDIAPKGRCRPAEAAAACAAQRPQPCPLSSAQATWTPWCCRCVAASPSWRSATPGSGGQLPAWAWSVAVAGGALAPRPKHWAVPGATIPCHCTRQQLTDWEASELTHSGCATSSARSTASPGVPRCPSQSLSPSRGIYLCGHSAGAHLAAMVLSTDWTEFQVVPDIKGSTATSQKRVRRRTGLHAWDKADYANWL